MLKTLTLSDFTPLIGSTFQIQDQLEVPLQLELREAKKLNDLSARLDNRSESFSLLFLGPDDVVLPQRIYGLHHSHLGDLSLFLVPVARREDGICYEAVFN
ncbi:hypothetical protein [Acaryochloris sp. IP29b_bin.137]|uniref:DUF6916 family protein n=1 Tax=Acaryochloris sp. IP29b_bin.137 TaxID=2969217 RepID=UPI002618DBE9|nr:hypothetical protein [Acaryochloris sp. IP29b_bin.137]